MFRSEEGVSAVEFALIAPLLFVLTFGIIEFSLLLFDKAVITNASREAARAAIVYNYEDSTYAPLDTNDVAAVVEKYTDKYLINLGGTGEPTTTTTYSTGTPTSGGDVTVQVVYSYDFLVFPDISKLIGGTFDGTVDLIGTTVMRME